MVNEKVYSLWHETTVMVMVITMPSHYLVN
jgi:hypothetical protein